MPLPLNPPLISWSSGVRPGGSQQEKLAAGLRKSKSAFILRDGEQASFSSIETATSRRKRELVKREHRHRSNVRQHTATLPPLMPPLTSPTFKPKQIEIPSSPVKRDDPSHGQEDVSPSLARLEKTVRHMGLNQTMISDKYHTKDHSHPQEPEFSGKVAEELHSWMYSTLASLPAKHGSSRMLSKHAKLPPLHAPSEVTAQTAQRETSRQSQEPIPAAAERVTSRESQEPNRAREAINSKPEIPRARSKDIPDSKSKSKDIPDVQILINRLRSGEKGFTESEIDRMRATYRRYIMPDSADVHKHDLASMTKRLGYLLIDEQRLGEIAEEVSVYSTLDFNEFVEYSQRCNKEEHDKFRDIFEKHDTDENGKLDANELRKLLITLGFTPLQAMIDEALHACDSDFDNCLDFEEFMTLLAVYRYTEGFVEEQLQQLHTIFGKLSKGKNEIQANQLSDLLLQFFGPQMAEVAKKLGAEVVAGRCPQEFDDDIEAEPQPSLTFGETLIWARRVRELEFQSYKGEFSTMDKSNTGFVKMEDVRLLIQRLGYTLSRRTIDEFVASCKLISNPGTQQLDFDEFVHLMKILRQSDGFEEQDVEKLKAAFHRFDRSGNEEIDILELSDIMRYLGHRANLDKLHLHIAEVDFNDSKELDFREFLRLMRLHREAELQCAWGAFEEHMSPENGLLTVNELDTALSEIDLEAELDHPGAHPDDTEAISWPQLGSELDFDAFVSMADQRRAVRVIRLRRCAGFSTLEMEQLHQVFEKYDVDKSGTIEPREVVRLLSDMGSSLNTKNEQDKVLEELDRARDRAQEVGIKDVGEMGSGNVTFWVFIQLVRSLLNRDDRHVLDQESRAIERARLSQAEVDQFREVFYDWVERDTFFDDEPTEEKLKDHLQLLDEPKVLSRDAVRRLLKSLGVNLSANHRMHLEAKLFEYDPQGKVNFADFLGLMRWMLDTNFADIQGSAAKAAKS